VLQSRKWRVIERQNSLFFLFWLLRELEREKSLLGELSGLSSVTIAAAAAAVVAAAS